MSGVVMLGRIEVQVQLAPSISQDLSVALALHAGKMRPDSSRRLASSREVSWKNTGCLVIKNVIGELESSSQLLVDLFKI